MALSQLQCLDDNHVNLRTNESKPEFLYSENQRLALEALLRNGREGFFKCLEARGLRGFLSDPELETLVGSVEPYDPDSELFLENAEEDEPPLSLHYWPELSDMSIPQMDLGWPDTESYRGVTRTAVYSQPPLEGQAHIKEVVRKMIAQAYKVIAVVMDVFTDVDIFRDLLDVSFKKKVSVYILLERSSLPHFLSMCQRANMHAGHLKNLRVRCTGGAEFYSRSSTKVRGQMGHRFMFIDGDKAMSGSYSFTWTSSRLDKNLITVVTGQAVEAFDRIYRILYSTSSFVNLQPVATEPEPEPEPVPQPVSAPPPSAEVARKLHNPKYALVNLGNPYSKNSPQETPNTGKTKSPEAVNKRGRKEALQEAPPLHPGLANLEKVSMMAYLPTWPDPDPTQDVIGYINIRDAKQTNQVHLQRSDYENSQAVRFSSPFSMPKKPLPEVATLRQLPGKPKEVNQLQPAQHTTKAKESQVDRASVNAGPDETKSKPETAQQNCPESGPKCESNKDETVNLNTENKHGPNATTNQQAAQNTAPQLNAHTPLQSSADKSSCVPQGPTEPGSNTITETQVNSTQILHTDLKKEQHTPHSVSHTQAVHIQSQNPSENSANASSSIPPLTSSSATPTQPVPSSAEASSAPPTSAPPVPKPRTIQLLIKDGITSDGKKLLECSTGSLVVQNEFAIVTELEASPDKAPEIVPDCQSSESSTGAGRDAENTVEMKDDPQQKEGGNLTTEESRVESVNAQEIVPNPPEPKRATTIDDKLPPQIDKELIENEASESTTTCSELAEAPNKNSDNVTNCKTNSAKEAEPSKISQNESVPTATGALETVDSTNTHSTSKAPEGKHTPEKPFHLQLAETHTQDLRSLTPDGELQLTKALARTPTPDGIHLRTPTPDSRTHTPDPRSYTPDFRTPTPDVSDGYVSAIEDSNLSTTSEDYYDCVDQGMTEDHASLTRTHSPNATNGNRNYCMRTISSETQSLSKTAEVSSSSSSLEKAEEKEEEETADKNKEAPSRAPKKNKVLNQSAAERPVSGGANDGVEPKRLSTGDSPPKTVCTEIEVADKEKKPLGPGVVARREKPPTSRESEGKKLVKTSSKSPEDQKQQDGASSPSRPTRSPQPLSGQCLERDGQKPQSPLLHRHSNSQLQLSPPSQNQTLSANHKVEGRGPFSLTFSRLYSLKDLKDKMSNLSVQSKKSSTPTQGGKSTS